MHTQHYEHATQSIFQSYHTGYNHFITDSRDLSKLENVKEDF